MSALETIIDYLVEHGMSEEDAHALVSRLLEEEAEEYIKTMKNINLN